MTTHKNFLVFFIILSLAFSSVVYAATPTTVNQLLIVFNKVLFWVSTAFWIAAGISSIYAAFLYLTAAGSEERVGKAKKQLLYTVIAIAVAIISAGLPGLVNNFLSVP
jgi:hypothetical protein